jgi:hypothetical protein
MPRKISKKGIKKATMPTRILSNIDFNTTSNWNPLPLEIFAKKLLINKEGKTSFLKEGKTSFLKEGPIIEEPDDQENCDCDGETPLNLAEEKGYAEICEKIIESISGKGLKTQKTILQQLLCILLLKMLGLEFFKRYFQNVERKELKG